MSAANSGPGLAALLFVVVFAGACGADSPGAPGVESLASLSTEALRSRPYGSEIKVERRVDGQRHQSFMTSYMSDGLRVYARLDLPAQPMPDGGYPVVVFLHGWHGIDAAPEIDFYYDADSNYGEMIDAYANAGFVVLVPGWRGHGTVNGEPADGIEYMRAWDNGSYISPVFYAIDVLNLVDSLHSIEQLDLANINLVGHSQGGDVLLIALAVAGEGSRLRNEIHAASIWSGTFPSRMTQLQTFHPMQSSPQAFMSGDGSWNGTAVGADGSTNASFVFGYPSDWIGTTDMAAWTWQRETWSVPTVAEAVTEKLHQMYGAVNKWVDDINDAKFEVVSNANGGFEIVHDTRVARAMQKIGGFGEASFLTEPLALQHSDRDFYSLPTWNEDLCSRINNAGGRCHDFEYPGNTHALRVSERGWFSDAATRPGFDYALARDIALFQGRNPDEIAFP